MLKRLGCFLFGGHIYQRMYQYRLHVPIVGNVGIETVSKCQFCGKQLCVTKFYSAKTEKAWLATHPLDRNIDLCNFYPSTGARYDN